MKRVQEWAVCPRIQCDKTSREPQLFTTLVKANRFLDEVVISWPSRATNRNAGWENPVPIKQIAFGFPVPSRRFQEFLPTNGLGVLFEQNLNDAIEQALDGRSPRFTCFLNDEWRFEDIERDSWKRVGHLYEGRKHDSVHEIIVKSIYDLDTSAHLLHTNLSCAAVADFFQSWQVWNHLAGFCYRVGHSALARALPGRIGTPRSMADTAMDFACTQLAAYAHDITSEMTAGAVKKSGSGVPTALVESYMAEFPDAVKLDVCWAAKQHYREFTRWVGGQLKSGSKPDRSFRAILTSGKGPSEYRREPRPKGWK